MYVRDSFFPPTLVWQSSKFFIRTSIALLFWTTYPLLSSYPQYCCQKLEESHKMINDKNEKSLEMTMSSNF